MVCSHCLNQRVCYQWCQSAIYRVCINVTRPVSKNRFLAFYRFAICHLLSLQCKQLSEVSAAYTSPRAKKLMHVAAAALLLVRTTAALSMAARGLPLQPSNKVVILGGGLQGCASAYYLKQRGFEDVTIVERTSVAAAASGKGGGFLARGWGSGPTRALHEVSFDLHAELAKTLNLKTYRKIKTLSVTGELQCINQIVAACRLTD